MTYEAYLQTLMGKGLTSRDIRSDSEFNDRTCRFLQEIGLKTRRVRQYQKGCRKEDADLFLTDAFVTLSRKLDQILANGAELPYILTVISHASYDTMNMLHAEAGIQKKKVKPEDCSKAEAKYRAIRRVEALDGVSEGEEYLSEEVVKAILKAYVSMEDAMIAEEQLAVEACYSRYLFEAMSCCTAFEAISFLLTMVLLTSDSKHFKASKVAQALDRWGLEAVLTAVRKLSLEQFSVEAWFDVRTAELPAYTDVKELTRMVTVASQVCVKKLCRHLIKAYPETKTRVRRKL